MKIVFLMNQGWPGVYTNLKSIQKIIRENYPAVEIVEHNLEIDSSVSFRILSSFKNFPPDLLFIGGWDRRLKMIVQNINKQKTKVFVQWCSPVTQMDLSGEIPSFLEVFNMVKDNFIDYLGLLLEEDYAVLKEVSSAVKYFPVWMDTEELDKIPDVPLNKEKINVDLFCAPCPRKNIFSQILALSPFKDEVCLFTNYSQESNMAIPYLTLGNTFMREGSYVNFSWMQRPDYLQRVKQMDFASQVTLSESFNYTAAEHMYFGVPVLMGRASPISNGFYGSLEKLRVDKHDDLKEINDKMKNLIRYKKFRAEMGALSREYIKSFNRKNLEILSQSIEGILK